MDGTKDIGGMDYELIRKKAWERIQARRAGAGNTVSEDDGEIVSFPSSAALLEWLDSRDE